MGGRVHVLYVREMSTSVNEGVQIKSSLYTARNKSVPLNALSDRAEDNGKFYSPATEISGKLKFKIIPDKVFL